MCCSMAVEENLASESVREWEQEVSAAAGSYAALNTVSRQKPVLTSTFTRRTEMRENRIRPIVIARIRYRVISEGG